MKVEASTLRDALNACRKAAPRTGRGLPVLAGARLSADDGELVVTCTDLDRTYSATVPASGDLDVIVPAHLCAEVVANLDGALTLTDEGSELVIANGDSQTRLRLIALDEWPNVSHAVGTPHVLGTDTVAALRRVVPFASKDAARVMLTGVSFTPERVATTDSYRAAVLAWDQPDLEALPLAEAVNVALDAEELTMTTDNRSVTFSDDAGHRWTTRQIDGTPPNIGAVIPDPTEMLIVRRQPLLEAVKATFPLTRDGFPVQVDVARDEMTVSAVAQDVGSTSRTVSAEASTTVKVGFNPRFFAELLKNMNDDVVTFGFVDDLKPWRVDDGPLTMIQMPVRIP